MQEHKSIALSWDFQKSLLEFGTQIPRNPLYTFHFSFFSFNLFFLDMGKATLHFVREGYCTMFGISSPGLEPGQSSCGAQRNREFLLSGGMGG